jgi:hypothetical protein
MSTPARRWQTSRLAWVHAEGKAHVLRDDRFGLGPVEVWCGLIVTPEPEPEDESWPHCQRCLIQASLDTDYFSPVNKWIRAHEARDRASQRLNE